MADTLDVLTLAEGYTAINATSGHDDELAQAITTVSRRLDEIIGPIVNRTVTEYHNGGTSCVFPHETPVSSVTTLTEADGTTQTVLTAETFAGQETDAYLLDSSTTFDHGVMVFRRNGGADVAFPAGRRNVELVYVAGRAANTGAVDARIKGAAAAILRRLWDREAGAWARPDDPFQTGGSGSRFFNAVDHVVGEQLAELRRPPGLA